MNRRSGRRRSLHRPQEHVLLAAERELDHAAALQRLAGDERFLVAERGVIDPQAAAADLAALDTFAAANGFSLTTVPEPAGALVIAMAACGVLQRRSRTRKASTSA